MDGAQVVPDAAAVAERDPRVAGAELAHMGAHRAGVGDHEAEQPAEEPGAAGQPGEGAPGRGGCVAEGSGMAGNLTGGVSHEFVWRRRAAPPVP